MKSVLIFCVVIAAALACPCTDICACPKAPVVPACPKSCPNLPTCVPKEWQIKTFDSACATNAFQGVWYLNLATPICIKDMTPIKVGLWSNVYPCSNTRVFFRDTTPGVFDYNTDYVMTDSSFNLNTQRVETTQTLFKAALGNKSPYALFNVGTEKYYSETIVEESPITDTTIVRHQVTSDYTRDYTLAVVGCDKKWEDYMIFAVVNTYNNIFCGKNDHFVWVFTRKPNPDFSTYQAIYNDLEKSSLSTYNLLSFDQSVDLTKVTTVTTDDIDGVVQTTSVSKSSSSKTCETVDGSVVKESSASESSSTTTKSVATSTTKSTVTFTLDKSYKIPYEMGTYALFGDYQILKGLKPEVITECFTGQYYVNYATPFAVADIPDAKIGLLNTAFPCSSLQVIFDDNNNPWDYKSPCMMLDRGYHVVEGKVQQTRSVIYSSLDGSTPYGVFTVYTEGYYGETPIPEVSPVVVDGMICTKPSPLYKQEYIVAVAGYDKDNFLILTIANKYKNAFYQQEEKSQFYVLTKERLLTQECITKINNDICRIGYNVNYMISIDQTKVVEEKFTFEESYFEITEKSSSVTVEESSSSSSLSVSKSVSSTVESSSSSCGCSEVSESASATASAVEVVA